MYESITKVKQTSVDSYASSAGLICYWIDLYSEKVNLRVDSLLEKIENRRQGRSDCVEFIERMTLEPLDLQIRYITEKISDLCGG